MQGERMYGANAEALAGRKPRYVYMDAHRTLGRNMSHPAM
jgi:hypothetical protein